MNIGQNYQPNVGIEGLSEKLIQENFRSVRASAQVADQPLTGTALG
jgi:hypothetical protein